MQKKSSNSVRIFYPRFNKEEVVKRVTDNLEALKSRLPFLLVSLFGSYAMGNYTVSSDIDLLVVYKGKERKDAYNTIKRAFKIPKLEPHVYTEAEFEEMRDTIKKMIKDGVVLYQEKE